jgi:aryl-alcohol dehydrogenase-like predicted oxidoreductase
VASVLAGGRRPDQVARNAKAMTLKLSPDVLSGLDQATDALKQKLGANIDLWQNTENARSR